MKENVKKKVSIPLIIGLIVGFVLIFAFAITVTISIVVLGADTRKLNNELNLGEKYISELDYDNAILAYENALSINPQSEDAYLGIVKAYEAKADECMEDDPELAVQLLNEALSKVQNGYEESGLDNIKSIIESLKKKIEETEALIEARRFDENLVDEESNETLEENDIEEQKIIMAYPIEVDKVSIELIRDTFKVVLETPGIEEKYYCDTSSRNEGEAMYYWSVTFTDGYYDYSVSTDAWNFGQENSYMSIQDMDSAMYFKENGTDGGFDRLADPNIEIDGDNMIWTGNINTNYEKVPVGFSFDDGNISVKSISIFDGSAYYYYPW